MSKKINELKRLKKEWSRERYPNIPPHAIPDPIYKVNNANGLTKCVQDLVNLKGGAMFRVNSQGQYDERLGQWRKSGSDPGMPDLVGILPGGRFLGVEVKYGSDRQSDNQKKTEARINKAGGYYLIVRDFDNFYEWLIKELTKFDTIKDKTL